MVNNFLMSRNIEYVLGNFIIDKISDDIASSVSDEKLMEFGLVYDDILTVLSWNVSAK